MVGEVVEPKVPKKFQIGISEDGSGWTTVAEPDMTSSNADLSPKRQSTSGDLSPKRRHDSDQDLSPPRKSDLSPPRKADISPKRRRHDSDNEQDLSPPRRTTPPPKTTRDISPPRKTARKDVTSPTSHTADISPPRRGKDDISKRKRHGSDDDDQSPARRSSTSPKGKHDGDLSPPRAPTMMSGSKSGLLSNEEITEEIKRKKQQMESRLSTDAEKLGKGAATVYRDKRGKKLSINEILQQQEGKFIDDDEANMEWGKGLVQKQEKEDMKAREEEEKNKPFARLPDDPELDDMYREVNRWGDPMLDQKDSDPEDENPKEKKQKKEKKEKKKKELAPERRWKGAAAPNRFNILPGHRWDGVDRSSTPYYSLEKTYLSLDGFEITLLQRESTDKAKAEMAYYYSVEDM